MIVGELMSCWTEEFRNHQFHQEWEKVLNQIKQTKPVDPSDIVQVDEITRFAKVASYIKEIVGSFDPELLYPGFLDPCIAQAQGCFANLDAYKNNSDIGHIRNANNNADEILKHIRANSTPEKKTAAYTKALDEQARVISEVYEKLKNEVFETVEAVRKENTRLGTTKKRGDAIDKYYADLFEGDENVKPIKQKIDDLSNLSKEVFNLIKSYEQDLLIGKDGGQSIKTQIEVQKGNIDTIAGQVGEANSLVSKTIQELKNINLTVFGGKSQDGQDIKGLEEEIEEKVSALNELAEEHKKKHDIILNEIKSRIGLATSAGLAGAFTEKRRGFTKEKYVYTAIFVVSIIGIGISGSAAYSDMSDLINQLSSSNNAVTTSQAIPDYKYQLISNLLHKLAWLVPLVWLALFSGSRRSESNSLEQEYAHKEAMSLSYENFRKQAEDLEEDEGPLQKRLLEAAIDTIAHNPAQALDKKHDEPTPAGKVVEPFANLATAIIEKIKS